MYYQILVSIACAPALFPCCGVFLQCVTVVCCVASCRFGHVSVCGGLSTHSVAFLWYRVAVGCTVLLWTGV